MDNIQLKASKKIKARVKEMMKRMKFKDETCFLSYCLLTAFKPFASAKEKPQVVKEISEIKNYKNR